MNASQSEVFYSLYSEVNGYEISRLAKENCGDECVKSFMYGEAGYETILAILNHRAIESQVKNAKYFCDIGSGIGNVLVVAGLTKKFKICAGVEFLPEIFEMSLNLQKKFANYMPKEAATIKIKNANAINMDYSPFDIIFANHPMKNESEMRAKLIEKLIKTMKPGAVFISVVGELPQDNFHILHSEKMPFSWGDATVRFYIKG